MAARLADVARDQRVFDETLGFLGYAGQDLGDELVGRIHEAISAVVSVARPAAVGRAFAADDLPLDLPGRDIARHLAGAREVTFVAATLGVAIDVELRRLKVQDGLMQVLFDAAASAAIERVMDMVEADVRSEAAERGLFCDWRFSAGYGDLPLSVQPRLLAVLDAGRRLGITLTESNLMVPTKSVTAIIGLHDTPQEGLASTCAVCRLAAECSLRARGQSCRGGLGA